MPSFPINRRLCTAATCWISRISNSEEGVVQCAPMVNVPHSPLCVRMKQMNCRELYIHLSPVYIQICPTMNNNDQQ